MLAVPGIRIVLDWRDGWSVSMYSGYGGTVPPSKFKAIIAKTIECSATFLARGVVVCTPGLLEYHECIMPKFLSKKIRMIPNGHELTPSSLFSEKNKICFNDRLTATCIGKFSEYGVERSLYALKVISERYSRSHVFIRLIGSDPIANSKIVGVASVFKNLSIEICPRQNRDSVTESLKASHIAIAIIRDDEYELGTKVFDYVAMGVPILDVFDKKSKFRQYFSGCFDTDYDPLIARQRAEDYSRKSQLYRYGDILLEWFR